MFYFKHEKQNIIIYIYVYTIGVPASGWVLGPPPDSQLFPHGASSGSPNTLLTKGLVFLSPHVPHTDPWAHRKTLRCQTYISSRNSQGHSRIPPRVPRATLTPHPRSPRPPRLPPDHHRRFPRNQWRFQSKHGHLWDPLWTPTNPTEDPQGSQGLPETSSRTP